MYPSVRVVFGVCGSDGDWDASLCGPPATVYAVCLSYSSSSSRPSAAKGEKKEYTEIYNEELEELRESKARNRAHHVEVKHQRWLERNQSPE
jgi:hypothetical protein